jgi:TP901 family phage tail tape measure protein
MPRTASVVYVGDAASLIRASQQAAAATKAATAEIAGANEKVAGSSELMAARTAKANEKVAASVAKAGRDAALGVVGVAGAAVDLALKMEKVTASIAAAGGSSTAEAKKIEAAFLGTAGSAMFSAQKIGTAYASIAGELKVVQGHTLGASEAMKTMQAAMDLTEATGGELNSTTESLGKVMLTYGLHTSKAAEASDLLFNASKMTGTSVETLAQTVDRMHGRMGALGPSLKETTGLMVELAKQGISGRQSLSTLNGVFTTLIGGGKATTAMQKELGLQVFDSHHKFVGLTSVIAQLQPKFAKLTQESQLQAAKALFGAAANKQLIDIIHQGPQAFQAATAAVVKHGAAHKAAQLQEETFGAQVHKLRAALEDYGDVVGNKLIPVLKLMVTELRDGADWLKKHGAAAKALAYTIGTVLGGVLTVFAYTKAKQFAGATKAMVEDVGTLAAKVAKRSGEVEASFAGQATAAETAAGKVATTEGTLAGEVEAADARIATANDAAGASFATMAKKAAAALARFGPWAATVYAVLNPQKGSIEGGGTSSLQEALEKRHRAEHPELFPSGPRSSGTHAAAQAAYLQKLGLPATVAAGLAGNFANEGVATDTGKEGLGIGQWTGLRRTELEAFAKSTHRKITDEGAQLEFAAKELMSKYTAVFKAAAHARTPQEAASILAKGYEKPEPSTAHYNRREQSAASAYGTASLPESSKAGKVKEYLGPNGEILHETAAQHAHRSLMERKAKMEGLGPASYVAPLSHAQITREDMGLDFAAHPGEAVKAIGSGVIDSIVKNWYKGQSLIEEKLTSGSHKGQYVYYAEQLNSKVRQGQHVKAGQAVATVAAGGTGLELGFGAGGGRTLAQARKEFHDHPGNDPTLASKAFASFLKSIGKGGSDLSLASKAFEKVTNAALAKQTADAKQGHSQLSKIIGAIHQGGVKELSKVVGGKHDTWLGRLVEKLHGDHKSALDTLAGKLVNAHKSALHAMTEAVQTAAKKAAETAAAAAKEAAKEASEQRDREAEAGAANDQQKADERAAAPDIHLSAYQGDLGKIELEQRAELLTPEQAKAAKQALANKALAGGYGELSGEGLLQVKGDLVEFGKALEGATDTVKAHDEALAAATKTLDEFNKASAGLLAAENASLIKSMADMISGRIAGVNFHGRAMTPGAGSAARY